MADHTVNPPDDDTPTGQLFEPHVFSRKEVDNAHLPGHAVMRFVNLTHDIAGGAEVAVDLLEWDDGREDFDEQRLLSANDRSRLRRLTSASLGLLLEECYRLREWAYERHTEQGREEARNSAVREFARQACPTSPRSNTTTANAEANHV